MKSALTAIGRGLFSFVYGLLVAVFFVPATFGVPTVHAAPAGHSSAAELQQSLRTYFSGVQHVRDSLPSDGFDPAAVVREVGGDPEDLRDWVADNITWVPYEGQLRDPSAVVLDRTGNSLDRAVLLSRLLALAGHQSRLARAGVTEEWAARHLAGHLADPVDLRPARLPEMYEVPDEVTDPERRATLNSLIRREERNLENLAARVETQLPILRGWFSDIRSDDAVQAPGVTEHWWVEVPDSGQRLDPSRAPVLEAEETLSPGDIPDERRHTVVLSFQIEKWEEGRLVTETAFRHPVHAVETGNRHFRIGFVPDGVQFDLQKFQEDPDASLATLREAATGAEDWLPYMDIDNEMIAEFSFSKGGRLHQDHRDSAQGGAMRQASGLLGGLGRGASTSRESTVLTAVSLELEWRIPGQEPRTETRILYDLLDADTRSDSEALAERPAVDEEEQTRRGIALMQHHTFLMQTSSFTRNFVSAMNADHLLSNRSAIMAASHYHGRKDPGNMQQAFEKITRFPEELYQFGLIRFMLNPHQTRQYLHEPSLIGWHQHIEFTEEGRLRYQRGYDLISTAVLPGSPAQDAAEIRLDQGVIDAATEAVLTEKPEQPTYSTSTLLQRTSAETWTRLDSQTDLDAISDGLSSKVYHQLKEVLDRGQVVMLPENLAELDALEAAWWELSPDSGKVTARLSQNGGGSSLTEQVVVQFLTIKGQLTLLAFSFAMCHDDPSFGCLLCLLLTGTVILLSVLIPGPGAAAAFALGNLPLTLGCGIFG